MAGENNPLAYERAYNEFRLAYLNDFYHPQTLQEPDIPTPGVPPILRYSHVLATHEALESEAIFGDMDDTLKLARRNAEDILSEVQDMEDYAREVCDAVVVGMMVRADRQDTKEQSLRKPQTSVARLIGELMRLKISFSTATGYFQLATKVKSDDPSI